MLLTEISGLKEYNLHYIQDQPLPGLQEKHQHRNHYFCKSGPG